MDSAPRVQRIADAIAQCAGSLPVRVLVGVRGNLVAAIFSDTRRVSGWTAPQTSISERVKERLLGLGPSVLVGLSSDQAAPSLIPGGFQEAMTALDVCSVGERVVAFYALSVRRLLLHRGADHGQSVLPGWFANFKDADKKSRGQLVKTLRVFADADMNVQSAARILHVHANTIYARLQRIRDITSLNAQRYHDFSEIILAIDCARL
jgi:sugar diacid utilization regulator